jgi:hypothetical protein
MGLAIIRKMRITYFLSCVESEKKDMKIEVVLLNRKGISRRGE